jgi:hypothetical protein
VRLKSTILILVFSLGASLVFGKTTSHTLFIGSSNYGIGDEDGYAATGMFTGGYRYTVNPKNTGFYYGPDITLGYPLFVYYGDYYYYYDSVESNDDLFMSLKFPFGYRWPGTDKKMGFYLGGGPVFQMLADFSSDSIYSVGIDAELGWQTNRTEGIGFHFGFQFGANPFVFTVDDGYRSDFWASEVSLQFGMSWRRVQN